MIFHIEAGLHPLGQVFLRLEAAHSVVSALTNQSARVDFSRQLLGYSHDAKGPNVRTTDFARTG